MTARRVAKEYEACTRGLNKLAPCVPPTGTAEEFRQVGFGSLVDLTVGNDSFRIRQMAGLIPDER